MPIYEYTCASCDHAFEELVRTSRDQRNIRCPKCGHRKVVRRPSVFAAQAPAPKTSLPTSGCERCGDPNGSCPFNE